MRQPPGGSGEGNVTESSVVAVAIRSVRIGEIVKHIRAHATPVGVSLSVEEGHPGQQERKWEKRGIYILNLYRFYWASGLKSARGGM